MRYGWAKGHVIIMPPCFRRESPPPPLRAWRERRKRSNERREGGTGGQPRLLVGSPLGEPSLAFVRSEAASLGSLPVLFRENQERDEVASS